MIVDIGGKLDSTYMHVAFVLYLTVVEVQAMLENRSRFAYDTFYFQ